MATKLSLILLAASTATAQVTTSYWLPSNKYLFGTDRLRYLASVVGAEGDRVTLAYHLDDDPDYSALGLYANGIETMTFASTMFEFSTSDVANEPTLTGGQSYKCEKQSTEPATCTQSLNSWMLTVIDCKPNTRPAEVYTSLWTYSDSGTTGVETIVRSFGGADPSVAEWCTKDGAEAPSSELVRTFTKDSDAFATYQFVITAGQEKLSATTGAGPTASNTKPTGTHGSTSGTGLEKATGTGAAAPVKTMAPLIAGLGAAVAVFL